MAAAVPSEGAQDVVGYREPRLWCLRCGRDAWSAMPFVDWAYAHHSRSSDHRQCTRGIIRTILREGRDDFRIVIINIDVITPYRVRFGPGAVVLPRLPTWCVAGLLCSGTLTTSKPPRLQRHAIDGAADRNLGLRLQPVVAADADRLPSSVTPSRITPPVAFANAQISAPRFDGMERLNSVV